MITRLIGIVSFSLLITIINAFIAGIVIGILKYCNRNNKKTDDELWIDGHIVTLIFNSIAIACLLCQLITK